MGLHKGQTNNLKGRPKGIPNKTTTEIRNLLQEFISCNMENLQSDFESLEPRDRLAFLEKALKFVLPTRFMEVNDLDQLSDEQLNKIIEELKKDKNDKAAKN